MLKAHNIHEHSDDDSEYEEDEEEYEQQVLAIQRYNVRLLQRKKQIAMQSRQHKIAAKKAVVGGVKPGSGNMPTVVQDATTKENKVEAGSPVTQVGAGF